MLPGEAKGAHVAATLKPEVAQHPIQPAKRDRRGQLQMQPVSGIVGRAYDDMEAARHFIARNEFGRTAFEAFFEMRGHLRFANQLAAEPTFPG